MCQRSPLDIRTSRKPQVDPISEPCKPGDSYVISQEDESPARTTWLSDVGSQGEVKVVGIASDLMKTESTYDERVLSPRI